MIPIDMDDIDDYYEAQALKSFFNQVIQAEKINEAKEEAAEKRWRENHPRTKLSNFFKWLARKIELPKEMR